MASPEDMAQSMINNLPDKTGKSLEAWLEIVSAAKLEKHGDIMKLLKGEHGVTHGYANLISAKARESGAPVDLVAQQYSGKENLKPTFDALIAFAGTLGDDVEIAPKKSSVSLRRKKQFALITPATKSRIDLGLALKGEDAIGRLETYNAMCSHRIRIENTDGVNDEVKNWMREAYSRAG